MALGLKKTIRFDIVDESLKDCYARFKPFGFKDYKAYIAVYDKIDNTKKPDEVMEQVKAIIPFFKTVFVDGKIFGADGSLRDMTAEDFDDPEFPVEYLLNAGRLLTNSIDPK